MSRRCLMICLFSFALGAGSANAATLFTSKSSATGFWSTPGTWTNEAVPGNGDDVQIVSGSTVILSGTSSNLNALTNSGNLMFTNWNSALQATNVTILSGGVMKLPAAFTNNGISNNIYVICTNLTIAAGGTINADSGGYAGLSQSVGGGPGGGSGMYGGGSYGGSGGGGGQGPTYGSPSAPITPGSAGGAHASAGFPGGSGGGAVRIQGSGVMTINGTITANGGAGSSSGGGSGGGIYIDCNTLAGTGGIVRACGNGTSLGGGGGGRIAVIYNQAAQGLAQMPSISFQTMSLNSLGYFGDIGTLYFPDNRFLTEILLHSGQWLVPGTTNLMLKSLLVSNAWIRFPADGFRLTVTNRMEVVGTDIKLNKLEMSNATVSCGGDMLVNKVALILRGGSAMGSPSFNCGGNLILTNGCAMSFYSGPTNGASATAWGALLSVTNDIRIATNSFLYLYAHPTNGGAPLLRMQNLTIAGGGTISADGGGYIGRSQAQGYGLGGGYGLSGGGGYGGKGGNASGSYGQTYGSSNAPVAPGSAGGAHSSAGYPGGSGGGAVRIEAVGTIALNGTISANGNADGPSSSAAAGSGGGIYITCRTFTGNSGIVYAKGGSGPYANGGGGRIAIWRVFDSSAGITASAAGGTTASKGVPEAGTIVWGLTLIPSGTVFKGL